MDIDPFRGVTVVFELSLDMHQIKQPRAVRRFVDHAGGQVPVIGTLARAIRILRLLVGATRHRSNHGIAHSEKVCGDSVPECNLRVKAHPAVVLLRRGECRQFNALSVLQTMKHGLSIRV